MIRNWITAAAWRVYLWGIGASKLCPDCGRPMVSREPWVCANCGEECEL